MKYTKSQSDAIHHEGENILVSASAGSGKTGVLKARVLRKLKQGIDIDQLIVLTFTEAAAEEMKSRIIDELKKEHLNEQMIKLDNAIISTFDAFTLRLVKEYYYLLDLPSDIGISDKLLIEMESQKLLDDMIKSYYESHDQDFEDMIKLLFSGSDNFLKTAILNLSKSIKKIPNYIEILEHYHDKYNQSMLEGAYKRYFDYIKRDLDFIRQNFKVYYINNYHLYNEACDSYLDTCMNLYDDLVKTDDIEVLKRKIASFNLPTRPRKPRGVEEWLHTDESYKQVKKIKQELESAHLLDDSDYQDTWLETNPRVKVILQMTKEYLLRLKTIQKEKNLYSFDDIMAFAIRLLEEEKDIRTFYQNEINEILIDEYQDTNDLQDYFISLIANHNIFMVGDVKQSIYRFRDANPKNFMRIFSEYSNLDGGKAIRLKENFRSNRFLLDRINDLFLNIMNENRGGVNYRDNHGLVSGFPDDFGLNQKNQPIHTLFYDPKVILEKYDHLTKDEIEVMIVANDIKRKIDSRQAIFDGNDFRPIEYKDITILVDRKTNFPKYKKVLSDYGIPVEVYSDEVFTESEEIIFLYQFLILIQCMRDPSYYKQYFKGAIYSVARSFVYQVPDSLILSYIINDDFGFSNLDKHKDLKRIKDDLTYISKKVDLFPNVFLIDAIYERLNIYGKIALLDTPESKAKKLDFFRDLVKGQKEKDFVDLIQYLEFVNQEQGLDIDYTESKGQVEAVKLMSIHKSKGLQFPIVYMLGLKKQFNFQENKDLFNFSPDYGILTHSYQQGFYRNFLENLYLRSIKEEDDSEKIRLLYVALTRAKEEINLVLEATDSLNESKITFSNYLEMFYYGYQLVAKDVITDLKLPLIEEKSHTKTRDKKIEHLIFSFNEEELDELRYSKSSSSFYSDQTILNLDYGNEIHEILENIDFAHLKEQVNTLPSEIKDGLLYLSQTPMFQSLDEPKYYQEFEFMDHHDGYLSNGVIDLLIEDKDKIYILDYKLKDIDDLSYEKQIKGYYDYIKKISNKEIQGYLFSILEKKLKRVI
ncbi:UvrD-helicase domain-containing protein [Mycoplasmatota bacterium]|nr:UvrD-helicase domain-containing protein [Mycoplasmatota bacterium]